MRIKWKISYWFDWVFFPGLLLFLLFVLNCVWVCLCDCLFLLRFVSFAFVFFLSVSFHLAGSEVLCCTTTTATTTTTAKKNKNKNNKLIKKPTTNVFMYMWVMFVHVCEWVNLLVFGIQCQISLQNKEGLIHSEKIQKWMSKRNGMISKEVVNLQEKYKKLNNVKENLC